MTAPDPADTPGPAPVPPPPEAPTPSAAPGAPSPRGAAGAIVLACCIWGLSPFYYRELSHVPPLETLAHRTIWSLVFFLGLSLATGRGPRLIAALTTRGELRALALAAAMVSANWALFIWAVGSGRIAESALGYYIFPLMMAGLGALVHGERFSPRQKVAMGIAAAATGVLALGLGAPPWVSLALAGTFALYGLIKKSVAAGPVVSVTVEVILLAPLALIWLAGAHLAGWSDFSGAAPGAFLRDPVDTAMLAASGALTGAPLALYSSASRGLPLSTVGLIAYLNPTLQVGVALATGEVPTIWHMIAFPMIWGALALWSVEALRRDRRRGARRGATAAR